MKYIIPFLSLILFTNCFLLNDNPTVFEPEVVIIPDFPVKTVSAWEQSAFYDSLNITKIDSGIVYSSEDWNGINFYLYESKGHPSPYHELHYLIWYKSDKLTFKEFQFIVPIQNTYHQFMSEYNREHILLFSNNLFDVGENTIEPLTYNLDAKTKKEPLHESEYYFVYSGKFIFNEFKHWEQTVGFITK